MTATAALPLSESTNQSINESTTFPLASFLDALFTEYHRADRIGHDPLQFPRRFAAAADQEVVALLAASLAWGRVEQIGAVLERLLARLGVHPAEALRVASPADLRRLTRGIIHRTATSSDLAWALARVGEALRAHGSLRALFLRAMGSDEETVVPALARFREALVGDGAKLTQGRAHLFPRPELGSACKRWMLFLRWVVRPRDGVDLGLWPEVSPARLVIPLDTHVHRIALNLRLTRRRDASLRTALEITAALRRWRPDDPVACDFALARLGILQECPTRVNPVICAECELRPVCRHGLGL